MAEYNLHCVYVSHFHYPINWWGIVGLFPVWAILNDPADKMEVEIHTHIHPSHWHLITFGYMPRSITIFIFWGASTLVSIMFVLIPISIKRVQGFPFMHILSNNCDVFIKAVLMGEVIAHCHFNLHFPSDGEVKYFFLYFLVICMSFFEICLSRSFTHFLNYIIYFLTDVWFTNIIFHYI